jgi:hypothetical protein
MASQEVSAFSSLKTWHTPLLQGQPLQPIIMLEPGRIVLVDGRAFATSGVWNHVLWGEQLFFVFQYPKWLQGSQNPARKNPLC